MNDNAKRPSLSTQKGDGGRTELIDGSTVEKNHLRTEAYGTLDEANALIGWARAKALQERTREVLLTVQNHLYVINSELACPINRLHLLNLRLKGEHLQQIESEAAQVEEQLQLPRKFVLYGQCESSAVLDTARAVVRRAERRIVELDENEPLSNPSILPYINRLSDCLFLFARYEEFAAGVPYAHPEIS
ncbi:MAG: cob(I)yrinic acid a,c-diamide adenosyltransferase [candidate division KSB1 bacterium]|nr:cob(I)yrinic acid a,c-diamide adenosyltransferase [candidate division KSB1 bacterium]